MMKDVERFSSIEELDSESKYLIHKAKEATAFSYAPYSHFHVGAALILEDGTMVSGANQENASYPLCMCAERVALYAAASQHPGKRILKMAIVAHRKNHKELTAATSCGACAQVILEFEQRQKKPIILIMMVPDQKWLVCSGASQLLPWGFTGDSLQA